MVVRTRFDLIVIGGGTGGLRIAYKSALLGYKTLLIENGVLGGTCLNMGCIPTKALLTASGLFEDSKRLSEFGIRVGRSKVKFKKLMGRVSGIINEGREHVAESVKIKNLTVINRQASFTGVQLVKAGSQEFFGKKIILATGSKSKKLDVEGSERVSCMDVSDILSLKRLPKSIGIIGGGYIAMEFATFFNQLGAEVTLFEMEGSVLPFVDSEVTGALLKKYIGEGIKFHLGSKVLELENKRKFKKIIFRDSSGRESFSFVEKIFVAVGRVPNIDGLDLETAGVAVYDNGAVRVNSFLRTTNKKIYAIGDVNGRAPFAHSAKREAMIALENALRGDSQKMDFSKVPWAVFTSPPISGIGKGEEELKRSKINYGVLRSDFSNVGRAAVIGKTSGLLKVFYEKKTEKILGAVIFGIRADELIHEFVTIIGCGGDVKKLKEIIHVHPTVSEVIGALR